MTIMPHSYRVSVGDQRADTPDGIRKAALLRARVLCPEPEGTVPDPPAPEAGIRWSLGWIRRYAS
jgi:hypothetical protein